jgi:TetR/AcrR family transcriptional repressor of mexJK operon
MAIREETESPKRKAILTAATDLFAARGYGAVSMDAIARAADVSKATLYAHFDSKDRLFATIVRDACDENFMPGEALPDAETDIRAALTAIGDRVLRFFLAERTMAIYRLVIAESVRFPELGQAFYQNGPEAGRAKLAPWLASSPRLLVPDPGLASDQFFGLLRTGLYMRATLALTPTPEDAEIAAAVDAAVSAFLRAYGRP